MNGETTTYILDGSTILGEKRSDGTTIRYLYDESGTPYAFFYNAQVYYYVYNAQGDVIEIMSTSGSDIAWYKYDAWGNVIGIGGDESIAELNPIRYRGYYYDNETGFYYLNSRYYDPEIGRFINVDGYVSTGQGLLSHNMFAYCGNNPVNKVDPNGDIAITAAIIITGLAVSCVSGLDMGISASMSGQNFWAGFGAGFIGGAVGYTFSVIFTPVIGAAGATIAGRGLGTAVTGFSNELLQNGNLDNMNWEIYLADIGMDMTLSMISPVPSSKPIVGGIVDGGVDIAQTYLYYTPEAQAHTRNMCKNNTNKRETPSNNNVKREGGGHRVTISAY